MFLMLFDSLRAFSVSSWPVIVNVASPGNTIIWGCSFYMFYSKTSKILSPRDKRISNY